MAETENTETETEETSDETTTETTPGTDDVAKWKALSRKNEKEAKAARAELEKLRTASMSDQEKAIAEARAEGRAEAAKESSQRLLRAEVRAQAAGLFADPDDAIHFLDLETFTPNEHGDFDTKQIRSALEDTVKAKPYLAPGPGNGSGEGGPRGTSGANTKTDPLLASVQRAVGA